MALKKNGPGCPCPSCSGGGGGGCAYGSRALYLQCPCSCNPNVRAGSVTVEVVGPAPSTAVVLTATVPIRNTGPTLYGTYLGTLDPGQYLIRPVAVTTGYALPDPVTAVVTCRSSAEDYTPVASGFNVGPAAGYCCYALCDVTVPPQPITPTKTLTWRGGVVTLDYTASVPELGLVDVYTATWHGALASPATGTCSAGDPATVAEGDVFFAWGACLDVNDPASGLLRAYASVCANTNMYWPAWSPTGGTDPSTGFAYAPFRLAESYVYLENGLGSCSPVAYSGTLTGLAGAPNGYVFGTDFDFTITD